MECNHKTIAIANATGAALKEGGYEVAFLIRCNDCKEELFRVSEYKREIVNLSKY